MIFTTLKTFQGRGCGSSGDLVSAKRPWLQCPLVKKQKPSIPLIDLCKQDFYVHISLKRKEKK
jgi:hypothetical protein